MKKNQKESKDSRNVKTTDVLLYTSPTVPDENLSPREMLIRFQKGLPVGMQENKRLVYLDDFIMPNKNMDMVDRQELLDRAKNDLQNSTKSLSGILLSESERQKLLKEKQLQDEKEKREFQEWRRTNGLV